MTENPYDAGHAANDDSGVPVPPSGRPTSVKVFGILNLVFAVMAICGLGGTIFTLFGGLIPQNPQFPNPTLDLIENNASYRMFMIVGLALGFIFTAVLAIGGVGLLQWRRYGRTASLAYGWYAIVSVIVGAVINYFFLLKPMIQQMQQAQGGGQGGVQQAAAFGGAIGGVIGTCFGLIYPILLLIFMNRRNVIKALR